MSAFEYSTLDPDDRTQFRDVVFPTLNIPFDVWEPFSKRLGIENYRALKSNGRIVAGMGIYRMGQWFGGNCLECGGVTVVGVAPEARGKGAAEFLVGSSLKELYHVGTPLAALYASTQRLYRKVGFEQAGTRRLSRMSLSDIGQIKPELEMKPASADNIEPFESVANRRAKISNGNLRRTEGLWERQFDFMEKAISSYLIGDENNPEGYLIYYQESDPSHRTDIHVRDMAALTPQAARTLWSFLYGHRSIVRNMTWYGPASEPLLCVPEESRYVDTLQEERWMLRIVNLQKSLEQRGYFPAVDAELHLEIEDDLIAENNGKFILHVSEGRGKVEKGGRGDLKMHIRGLATLFSSFLPARTLRMTGWLKSEEKTLLQAEFVFCGPEPWMPEIF